jgi:hypothetical protein
MSRTQPSLDSSERTSVTREVPDSQDLSVAMMGADARTRVAALHAAAALVAALARAGARHHDLNVKNILLHTARGGESKALVLDVDRVELDVPAGQALEANLARLLRSARKWQSLHGARVTETELLEFASVARADAAGQPATRS